MKAWAEAKRAGKQAGQKAVDRQLVDEQHPAFMLVHSFESQRCFLCGKRHKLVTGILGGVRVWHCPACDDEYRRLKMRWSET